MTCHSLRELPHSNLRRNFILRWRQSGFVAPPSAVVERRLSFVNLVEGLCRVIDYDPHTDPSYCMQNIGTECESVVHFWRGFDRRVFARPTAHL